MTIHNGYNYRTLNPWEQTALEHLSAMIGEIIGAGFENPSHLIDRVNDMVLEISYWDTPNNCDTQQIKYIPYGASGEDGDKEINPSWDDSEEEDKTQIPGFQDVEDNILY